MRRQELCRDFQRGSCRYGSNCKFLHQQPGGNRDARNQSAPEHRCNDPRACKEKIEEDFRHERPTYWRLTSYGHWKHLPNDINGDTSFEELRAMAYESARQGASLADIRTREAMMFRAKEAEFDALRRGPYKGPARNFSPTSFGFPSAGTETRTIFGTPVPANSPASQIFQQNSSTGGFGNGPVFSPPQFQPSQMISNPASPFPLAPQNPPNPPFSVPSFNVFSSPSSAPSPFSFLPGSPNVHQSLTSPQQAPTVTAFPQPFPQPASQPASAPSMGVQENSAWLAEQWELGQIPEDEPPVPVR